MTKIARRSHPAAPANSLLGCAESSRLGYQKTRMMTLPPQVTDKEIRGAFNRA
jgi:hypothetical protein